MSERRKFIKRPDQTVVAVQLLLDTDGFTYRKWGGAQACKAGDWIVNDAGDVYTVDRLSFGRTYREVSPGVFLKTAPVWAEPAVEAGSVRSQEGATAYGAGDYLVFNEENGEDPYAVSKLKFEATYQPME